MPHVRVVKLVATAVFLIENAEGQAYAEASSKPFVIFEADFARLPELIAEAAAALQPPTPDALRS